MLLTTNTEVRSMPAARPSAPLSVSAVAALAAALLLPCAASAKPKGQRLALAPVEASSALWRGWNDPKADHHPLFAADGSGKTAWVEGAEGDGAGEWIRFHVAPTDGVDEVRLRVRNGCQADRKAFKRYARLAKVKVIMQPGGAEAELELADKNGWQTHTVPQPAGRLESVELRIDTVHRGGGGEHACLSEAQVFVPAGAAVDPKVEKRRLGEIKAWKKARRKTGKRLRTREGRRKIPFAPRYVARSDGQDTALDCGTDQICFMEEGLRALQAALGDEAPPELARALTELRDDDWNPVTVTSEDKRPVPPIDGLCAFTSDAWPCPQGVYLPPQLGFLDANTLRPLRAVIIPTLKQVGDPQTCVTYNLEQAAFVRPAAGRPTSLVTARCGRRGGEPHNSMMLMVYDPAGRLVVTASEREAVVLSWSEASKKSPARLSGARKLVIRTGIRTALEPEQAID